MNELVTTTETALPARYDEGQASLAVSLARAEVDQQIATARALPRSIQRAVSQIMTLATLDEESAEECVYALPRGGKPIKGPSVRLAEIIASQWGNCRVGARVVHVDRFEKYVEAEGVFHDLETNTATTARVRRRISDKSGKLLTEDMIVVTGNAACSIAKRNAILGAVPKAVWRKAYAAVESVIAGDVKTLVERRDRAMKAFAAFGVKPEQVYEAIGVGGVDDISLDHMTTLLGMHSALKSGESNVEEMFPRRPPAGDRPKSLSDAMDKLAKGPTPDPETGEIKEPTSGSKEAPATGQAVAGQPAEGAAPRQGQQDGGALNEAPPSDPSNDSGDQPSPVELARERGAEAKRDGLGTRAMPGEYREEGREAEAEAWMAGHKAAETAGG
ncbi:MAG: hypothetical protein DI537_23930 [Stutzerimonas stutzeri]|nr:MAG: hypothetical protein DI537_23930 [Stutzerimonas stutzeri]